jgi:hypothetical protein
VWGAVFFSVAFPPVGAVQHWLPDVINFRANSPRAKLKPEMVTQDRRQNRF